MILSFTEKTCSTSSLTKPSICTMKKGQPQHNSLLLCFVLKLFLLDIVVCSLLLFCFLLMLFVADVVAFLNDVVFVNDVAFAIDYIVFTNDAVIFVIDVVFVNDVSLFTDVLCVKLCWLPMSSVYYVMCSCVCVCACACVRASPPLLLDCRNGCRSCVAVVWTQS